MPIPPFCRDKWPQNRVNRGSKYWSCANSICSLPSRVRARCAKMSRINEVRSRTLQLKIFSRLRLCPGESSSSKITVSTSARLQWRANSSALPLPINVAAHGPAIFWVPSPITTPPAVTANSESSSRESPEPFLDLSSTPTRKTRSVFRSRVSIKAFNSVRLSLSLFVNNFLQQSYHVSIWRKATFPKRIFNDGNHFRCIPAIQLYPIEIHLPSKPGQLSFGELARADFDQLNGIRQ